MQNNFYPVIMLFCVLLVSCFKHDDCDPNKVCNTEYPDSAFVNVNVSYNGTDPVYLVLYRGQVEDNEIILTDTLTTEHTGYFLPVKERYAAKVTYTQAGKTVYAYDGGKLKVDKSWNCDERCYDARNLNLDLRLLK